MNRVVTLLASVVFLAAVPISSLAQQGSTQIQPTPVDKVAVWNNARSEVLSDIQRRISSARSSIESDSLRDILNRITAFQNPYQLPPTTQGTAGIPGLIGGGNPGPVGTPVRPDPLDFYTKNRISGGKYLRTINGVEYWSVNGENVKVPANPGTSTRDAKNVQPSEFAWVRGVLYKKVGKTWVRQPTPK